MKLLHGDCLELMKGIPDGSIDMILCDLPYGTTQCKWDSIIPFEPLWEQYKRVTKENGAVVLFGSEPFTSLLICSSLSMFKYNWYWRKPKGTGFLNAKKQPLRDVETISVFYRKQCAYNPQFTSGIPFSAAKVGRKQKVKEKGVTPYGRFMSGVDFCNDNDGFRYPKQLLEFGYAERGAIHPTQKPVPLLEYLIKTYTNEGDTVLDNCMGSGSTGVACVNTNRDFIGIELDADYFQIAKNRIEQAMERAEGLHRTAM